MHPAFDIRGLPIRGFSEIADPRVFQLPSRTALPRILVFIAEYLTEPEHVSL